MTYPGTKMELISLKPMFCIHLRHLKARFYFQKRKLVGLKVWALKRCKYHLTSIKGQFGKKKKIMPPKHAQMVVKRYDLLVNFALTSYM